MGPKNKKARSTEITWLRSILGFKLFILLAYMTSHYFHKGERLSVLSSKQLTDIYTMVKDADSAKYSKNDVINRVYLYLENNFDQEILTDLKSTLGEFSINEFPTVLSTIKLRIRSFFWLTGKAQAGEIVFWSILGVLASLLYHGSEAIRKREFEEAAIIVHIAKIFYAPTCAIVIIFSVNALTSSGDVSIEQFQYWLIILSFILGFFSGRTIELLDRIKDLILPLGKNTEVIKQTPQKADINLGDVSKQNSSGFSQLSLTEQDHLVREYINNNGEGWRQRFPELTGITAGRKQIEGSSLDLMSVVFQVAKKTRVAPDKFPKFIDYREYHIPTDVQEYGTTKAVASSLPLEGGISRINDTEFGTIGIPVRNEVNETLMLTCFHVLFNQELKSGKKNVRPGELISSREVISPSSRHGGTTNDVIGDIVEGEISEWVDVAVFKPRNENTLQQTFSAVPGPFGVSMLTRMDENKTFVQFWGRGSNCVVAMPVINIFSNQWIEYIINGQAQSHFIKGLIQLGKTAKGGDSGAPVFDAAGNFVGLLIGSDDKSAYMISYTSISLNLKYKIKTL